MTTDYPLAWPPHVERTEIPENSRFDVTLHKALKNVETSLERFGKDTDDPVTSIVISSNVSLRRPNPADAGIAVYFNWDGRECCIAVDRYLRVFENLQAVHHIIEAERTKLRHGGLNIVRATFRGYEALPAPSRQPPWSEVLHVKDDAPREVVESAYRNLAKRNHPDAGGDAERMSEINEAWKQARDHFRRLEKRQ